MTESSIIVGPGGTTFAGRDAVELFRAMTLRSALGLLSKGITPTRGLTLRKALDMAGAYTGKKYKRTEAVRAASDLVVWIETMRSALPIQQREERS